MSTSVTVSIRGGAEIRDSLAEFGTRLRNQVLERVLAEVAEPIKQSAKYHAPQGESRALFRSIDYRIRKYAKGRSVMVLIGPRTKAGEMVGARRYVPTRYAHLMEWGFDHHNRGGSGPKTAFRGDLPKSLKVRRIPGYHFMLRAWRSHGGMMALLRFEQVALREVRKTMSRLSK